MTTKDVTVLCPRCEKARYTPYKDERGQPIKWRAGMPFPPALSRTDNKTLICSECGTAEAMRDFAGAAPQPPTDWPVAVE